MTKTQFAATLLAFICYTTLAAQQGLVGEYFNGTALADKKFTRTDAQINFNWNYVPPVKGLGSSDYSIRWTGKLKSPESGNYRFRAHVDDGIRVKVGGKMVIDAWGLNDSQPFTGTIELEAGRTYDFVVEYFNGPNEGEIQLFWQLPSEKPIFKGAFGYNDKVIDSRYFSQPTPLPAPPVAKPTPPKSQPVKTPAKPARPTRTEPARPKPAPAKTTAAAPLPADTLERYIPKNILFVKSKSEMLPSSHVELDNLAGFLLRNPKLRLTIEGHTDKVGNSAKNLQLSKDRAARVAAYMTEKGIAATRIKATGYGDTRPLVQGGDPKNRRVEFILHE